MIGNQISHYRILSKIGKGGMGEVYQAEDLRLDRKVALKFLPDGRAPDEAGRRRLLHEAHAAARLDHPFITKVYEVAQSEAEPHIPFIAMELVEGATIKERLASGPMAVADAVRIASEIAEALEFARQCGIVHRDLKPANVMLTVDGHAKVMDFGIAKYVSIPLAGGGHAAGPTMTASGVGEVAGTPAYMAPEQLNGLPLDSRADIFSLGVCLYEMVTGTHPFLKDSIFATADAILNQPAPPLDRYLRDPPDGLEHVFRRALAKDPDQRYQSFKELRIDLGTVAVPQTRRAIAPPVRTRARPKWLPAALIALVAAGGGLAWRLWPDRLSLSQPALAFNQRDWILITDVHNLTDDPVFDRSLGVALEVAIAQSQYVNVFPTARLPETLRLMKKAPAGGLDEALATEVALREHIKAVLVCSIARIGDSYTLAAKVVDPQSRLAVRTESTDARGKDAVLPALDELATRVRRNLGESLASISAQKVALPRATTASIEALRLYADSRTWRQSDEVRWDLLKQAIALDPDFAMAHAAMGYQSYMSQNRQARQEGEAHFVKALSLLDRLTRRERLWITALAEDSRGNRAAAISVYQSYLSGYPDDQVAWFRLGWSYLAGVGQAEPAADAFRHAIALSPSDPGSYINLATAYSALGKYQEAVQQYRRGFDLNPSLRTDAIVNHEYGFVLIKLGDLEGAAASFAKMLTATSTSAQARGHRSIALLEMYRGRYGVAIEHLRQAVVINRANTAAVSEYRDRLYLAQAYRAKGMTRPFAVELGAAHRLALDSSLAPEWLRRLAKAEARAGRVDQARAILALMAKTAGDATASSSMNRNADAESAHFAVARGEIELAAGRAPEAVELLRSALVVDPQTDTLESLAAALLSAGQLEEAAKRYEDVLVHADVGTEGQELWLAAHVRLAGIYTRLGRHDRARALPEALLAQWKDADDDLVLLRDARNVLARAK